MPTMKVIRVAAIKLTARDQINLVSLTSSALPMYIPKYTQIAISTAANGAAGTPNNIVGNIEAAFCELLAPSQPASPLGLPLPNFSLGFAVTVIP